MSHTIVSAEKVRKVCEVLIDHEKMMKSWTLAKCVYEEAHRKPWFGLGKPVGYEQALALVLENSGLMMDIRIRNDHHNSQIEECRKLLILAKIGDPVVITHEHAYMFKAVLHGTN